MVNQDKVRFSGGTMAVFGKRLRRVIREVAVGFDALTHVQFDRPWDHTTRRQGWPGSRGV